MGKHRQPSAPKQTSQTIRAKEERHYRADGMVRDAMTSSPEFNRAVRKAERELVKVEAVVKSVVKGKKK